MFWLGGILAAAAFLTLLFYSPLFITGQDGKPSTSKFQWWLWTVIVVLSYIGILIARLSNGDFTPVTEIQSNLLVAMGFSTSTMVLSKGITVGQVESGRIRKQKTKIKDDWKLLFKDDQGNLDLSKVQMLVWTLIAIAVFVITVIHQISIKKFELPNIDTSLMALMGLGQAGYIGKKLTTTTTPRLTGLTPGSGAPGQPVIIKGISFGDNDNRGGLLTLDDTPITDVTDMTWDDTEIKFRIPQDQPIGRVSIGVTAGGQESANKLPFNVTK